VFPESEGAMRRAVGDAGLRAVAWDDAWWSGRNCPRLEDHAVVFHGSLGNADRIRREVAWRPGAYCRTEEFRCSAWFPRAAPWLLHRSWAGGIFALASRGWGLRALRRPLELPQSNLLPSRRSYRRPYLLQLLPRRVYRRKTTPGGLWKNLGIHLATGSGR
jgi:hypothetical protein